jgi:HK97 family phage major capsid protein
MKQSIALKEERASAITELEGIVNAAQAESREFTETEEARQAELNDSIFALDEKIEAAEKTEQILARSLAGAASKSEEVEMEQHAKEYSFRDAVNMALNGRLEGREREMHEEARAEFQAAGVTPMGNLFIPLGLTHRATSTASGVVGTTQQGLLQGLVPESVIEQAGGNRITGVAGSVKLPSLPTDATLNRTEVQSNDGGSAIASKTIDAKRIASRIDISNQTLAMANGTFDSVVAAQFRRHAGGIMDLNAWTTWSANANKVLRSTAAGSTIKEIDFVSANDLIAALGNADALNNSAVFFGNHATLATARSQQAVTNGGIPTLQADGTIAGYKAYGHSQITNSLLTATNINAQNEVYDVTATTAISNSTDGLPFFLVNMNDVYCCYWGGADLIVDNMSQAHLGTTRMIMNYYANCDVAHNASVKYVATV